MARRRADSRKDDLRTGVPLWVKTPRSTVKGKSRLVRGHVDVVVVGAGNAMGARALAREAQARSSIGIEAQYLPRSQLLERFGVDNSAEAAADGTVPDPLLVLEMENGRLVTPSADNLKALQEAPEWTRSVLEAALRGWRSRR